MLILNVIHVRQMLLKVAAIIIVILCVALKNKASNENFSGSWKFIEQKSILGNSYINGLPKIIKFIQYSDSIYIEKIAADSKDMDVKVCGVFQFNGLPSVLYSSSNQKKSISIIWNSDQRSFTEIANIYNGSDNSKIDYSITDDFRIEDEMLILLRKVNNSINGEIWESKGVYRKM